MIVLLSLIVGILIAATAIGRVLESQATSDAARRKIENLNARIRSWWVMTAVFGLAILLGQITTVILFAFASFLALREFITSTPTRPGDHRALFWSFFVILPIQYFLVGIQWYAVFAIFIPVYAFLFIPIRIALAGEIHHYVERTAKIQWGLMTCVYFVSHAPAILLLNIPGYEGKSGALLLYFLLIVELNDVFQYIFGNLYGKTKITPRVSPNKTWEGFIGGLIATTVVGAALSWVTPFNIFMAAGITAVTCTIGFCGDIVMSAVKRDMGVKDYSDLIPGHGGALDRLDSLSFAAPLFFHLTRFFYVP